MNRTVLLVTGMATAVLLACSGVALAQQEKPAKEKDVIADNYIVVLKDKEKEPKELSAKQVSEEHAAKYNAKVKHVYEHALKGYAAELSADKLEKVKADSRVLFVSEDRPVEAFAQSVPTGIKRIGLDPSDPNNTTRTNNGRGVGVAVIDTGIQLNHPDLQPVSDGPDCVNTGTSADDDNGHGTHVAGTIAARNNDTGVVGVAPEADLYAVKVLNSSGSGSWSSVICGVDWVTANASTIKVANMSLGGSGSDSPSNPDCTNGNEDALHRAICRSVNAGVTYAVAAGNNYGQDLATKVPAAYDEALTVTALADFNGSSGGGGSATCRTDVDDTAADFSNNAVSTADQNHTLAAPGVCINSTWLNGGYNRISGTSMATPHAAGTAALYLANNPGATPAQVITTLRDDASAKSGNDRTVDGYYGFTDDPNSPNGTRYYGYTEWPGGYLGGGGTTPSGPETTIASGGPSGTVKDRSASFTYSSSDPSATFECSLDGEEFSSCPTAEPMYSNLAEGQHTFKVRATNSAGTDPTPASRTWTIDTTPPDTTIDSGPTEGSTTSSAVSFKFSTTEAGSTFECRLDGSAWASCTSPKTYNLSSGSHTFEVRAKDVAGNTDGSWPKRTWMVDETLPVILTCPSGTTATNTCKGNIGPDNLSGTSGDDFIEGLAGDDTIDGKYGDDTIWGGAGRDTIYGGFNRDKLHGDDGDDTIYGGYNRDEIEGGPGKDKIRGENDADTIWAAGDAGDGSVVDDIDCGSGTDTVTADRTDTVAPNCENVTRK